MTRRERPAIVPASMRRLANACVLAAVLLPAASAHAGVEVERYALSMFHFNVQYVAGGLVG
jgi:hypothetical protein